MQGLGRFRFASMVLLSSLLAAPVLADTGEIRGEVIREDGTSVSGVTVEIDAISRETKTDLEGKFVFREVPGGSHTLSFSLLTDSATMPDITLTAGKTTRVKQVVDWEVPFTEQITVYSVSRRREKITDAPAAVTKVTESEIARAAVEGQLPKLVEFTPAVDFAQSQLYDFSMSTRGFNGALNRRMAVFLDGRDAVDPFTGAPEWATLALPLDDLASVELQRGPSTALYGTNATSGVLSMTSRSPRDSQGSSLRVVSGEQSTSHVDLRWSGAVGDSWYLRAVGGRRTEDYFAVSRQSGVEYGVPCTVLGQTNCLPLDAAPFPKDEIVIETGSIRADRYTAGDSLITIEAGTTDYEGTVFVNPGGTRGQITGTEAPWARFNFNSEHWNVLAYYNERHSDSLELTGGGPFSLESDNTRIDVQTNWSFAEDRIRLVAGGLVQEENVDTIAALTKIENDEQAVYAQIDWSARDDLRLVGALRWDHATLYDAEVSPRAGIVWNPVPKQTLRFTYNEGFQVPTYLEYFLYFPVGPPSDLDSLCPVPLTCGLEALPVLALGNESLDLESTKMFEVGWNGILGRKAMLSIDYYDAEDENFTTSFIPQVTPAGLTNPAYGPWTPPLGSGLTEPEIDLIRSSAAAILGPGGAQLTNLNGDGIVLLFSVANIGQADTRGVDVSFVYHATDRVRLATGYSWFDFDIKNADPGVEAILWPNAPEHRGFARFSFLGDGWDVNLAGRWVDDFRWANGGMDGLVPAYEVFDLTGNYTVTPNWRLGIHVTNLLDDEHWETFGGSRPPRRALAYASFLW